MTEKGLVQRDAAERAHVYPPTFTEEAAQGTILTDLLQTMMRPADPMLCPSWPFGRGSDVPFVELFDGFGSGIPAGPADDILYYQAHGVLRFHPLRPPDSPLDAMNAVLTSGCRRRF